MYINRTIKCLKRLQKRSIDDNLRQLVLIRQDPTSSLQVILDFFFFYFSKKMGRSGEKKRNILRGWPYQVLTTILNFPAAKSIRGS